MGSAPSPYITFHFLLRCPAGVVNVNDPVFRAAIRTGVCGAWACGQAKPLKMH